MRFQTVLAKLYTISGFGLVLGASSLAYAQQAPSDASYPAPGHTYEAKFGDRAYKLVFDPAKPELTFSRGDGYSDTVVYTAKEIRPGVFLVYWQETSGTRVAVVQDFEKGVLDTNIAAKDGKFYNLHGTWKRLD